LDLATLLVVSVYTLHRSRNYPHPAHRGISAVWRRRRGGKEGGKGGKKNVFLIIISVLGHLNGPMG
jgi:hypothetical protein